MTISTGDLMARAIELWEAQGARDAKAEEAAFEREALAELNIPPEYWEKAREELDEEAQQTRARGRSRRFGISLAVIASLAAVFLMQIFHPYSFWAWESSFQNRTEWHLHVNSGTDAEFALGSLQVNAFSTPPDGRYFANLRATDPPRTLWGRDEMILRVRGEGLQATRVYLRSGATERWRSPRIPLTPEWVEHRIPIDAFERQTGGRAAWEPAPWATPVGISMLQLKVGYAINEFEATGTISLEEIRFE